MIHALLIFFIGLISFAASFFYRLYFLQYLLFGITFIAFGGALVCLSIFINKHNQTQQLLAENALAQKEMSMKFDELYTYYKQEKL